LNQREKKKNKSSKFHSSLSLIQPLLTGPTSHPMTTCE
jgi:hypothetical protein